jgi:hypothetical protein
LSNFIQLYPKASRAELPVEVYFTKTSKTLPKILLAILTALLEDGTKRSRPRGRDQDRKEKKARTYKHRITRSAIGHETSCDTSCSIVSFSQVLGTVQHGNGHKDAAGVLTSAGAPLWFIRGCSPQHTSFGGRDREVKTTRSRPGNKNVINICDITRVKECGIESRRSLNHMTTYILEVYI